MSKLGRLWDRLLPGLICLCPMGAMAYYNAGAENDVPQHDSASTERHDLVSHSLMGAAAVPLARL
jgi:hypothetical protein